MKNFVPWLLIAVLVIIVILERSCKEKIVQQDPVMITHRDTVPGDSFPYIVQVAKPYPVRIDCLLWRDRPVDTMAILQAYFVRRIYYDTLKNDTSAFVAVYDTVERNQLQGRALVFQNRRPVALLSTTTIQMPDTRRVKVYAGLALGRSLTSMTMGASIMLVNKRDHAYQLTYDIFNQDAYFTMLWKISFRSRNKDPS